MSAPKTKLLIVFFFFTVLGINSQIISDFKPKFDNFGMKPKKKASKKVYINSFNVLVEVYREDIDYKEQGEFRGKGRAEASAQAALGIVGVDSKLLLEQTDRLYKEFISNLEAQGFEIVASSEVKNTKYHKGSESFEGPIIRESANPGMLEIIPSEFKGFTSKKNAEGKESKKSGFFPGMKGLGKMAKNTNMLSKQLNDAIVLDVNLTLAWSKTGGSWFNSLSGANAKIETQLALGEKAISAPKNSSSKSKGGEDYYILPNDFVVAQGSGMKKVSWKGYLKKPITIDGVLENTTVETFNRGQVAKTYDIGNLYRVTEWTSTISENAKFVEVDGNKFAGALYASGKAFIDSQLDYLFENYQ